MRRNDGGAKGRGFGVQAAALALVWLIALLAATAAAGPAATRPGDDGPAAQEADDGGGDGGNGDEAGDDDSDPWPERIVNGGATGAADDEPESASLPGESTPSPDTVLGRRALSKAPSYRLLERSLQHQERRLGVQFFRNAQGRYMPYATASWDSFSIPDRQGECLYDINVLGVMNYRHLEGRRELLLDLEVTPGPCGLSYPNAQVGAMDRVSTMEGAVVSPALIERLDASGMCSDKRFLQETLQFPYRIEIVGDDIRRSVARVGQEVRSPLEMAFGDVVFFTPYPEERAVGIYVGYGLVVYNSCFGAKAHKMESGRRYEVFRLVSGFAQTRYRIHDRKFIRRYLGEVE